MGCVYLLLVDMAVSVAVKLSPVVAANENLDAATDPVLVRERAYFAKRDVGVCCRDDVFFGYHPAFYR